MPESKYFTSIVAEYGFILIIGILFLCFSFVASSSLPVLFTSLAYVLWSWYWINKEDFKEAYHVLLHSPK